MGYLEFQHEYRRVIATEKICPGDWVVFTGNASLDTFYARPHHPSEPMFGVAVEAIDKDAEGTVMVRGHFHALSDEAPKA